MAEEFVNHQPDALPFLRFGDDNDALGKILPGLLTAQAVAMLTARHL